MGNLLRLGVIGVLVYLIVGAIPPALLAVIAITVSLIMALGDVRSTDRS